MEKNADFKSHSGGLELQLCVDAWRNAQPNIHADKGIRYEIAAIREIRHALRTRPRPQCYCGLVNVCVCTRIQTQNSDDSISVRSA